ncbi:MAG TPA: two-component regulator propeller domain-containing protein, partial [Chitinophagaceae bacterium]|nr:two-component regulator propeller domain-containing protein [Chitinophagaceae bacterium]
MKYTLYLILKFLVVLFIPCHSISQVSESLHFDHLSTADGLSYDKVRSIVQDHTGFIWIATANGLNRYDGHRFKTFYSDFTDSSSLPDNRVVKLFTDSKKNLWICTRSGVSRYDPVSEKFENFFPIYPDGVKSALVCNDIIEINDEYFVA